MLADWKDSDFRRETIAAFAESGDPTLEKHSRDMVTCCESAIILARSNGASITPAHCDRRACQLCTYHRTRKARRVFEQVSKGKHLRFATFTQEARAAESYEDARARLYATWAAFRRRKEFKEHVTGALRVCEPTWREERGSWHLHFHVIYEGQYWPQAELQSLWESCGGGIVDIRAATSVDELLKYALKTANVPRERVVEWAQAMHGKRDVEFLGSWRGVELEPELGEEPTADDLAAFRYTIEDDALEHGDVRPVSEDRLKYVAFADPEAPPHVALWSLHRLRDCFRDLSQLRERVEKRLAKRENYG